MGNVVRMYSGVTLRDIRYLHFEANRVIKMFTFQRGHLLLQLTLLINAEASK